MKNIFSPAIKLFNNLKIPQKLGLVSSLFVILIIGMLISIIIDANKNHIEVAKKELYGATYIKSLMLSYRQIQDIKGGILLYSYSDKDYSKQEYKKKIIDEIQFLKASLKIVDLKDKKYDKYLNTHEKWLSFRQNTEDFEKKYLKFPTNEILDGATKLLKELGTFISYIGDSSSLIFDPEIKTHYLMLNSMVDTTSRLLLKLQEKLNF